MIRHGHHDDGHLVDLPNRQRAGLVVHAGGLDPALEVGAKTGSFQAAPQSRHCDLLRMHQVEGQVRGRRVALLGHRVQAAQDHLLQPLGQIGAQLARRRRVHPKALAQTGIGLRVAKGQLTGRQFVQHDADGKDVAARIAAHAYHLFRRHVDRRTHRAAQLLGQQVGVVRVKAQTKIEQQRAAVRAYQHIGRFQVQVHGVLLVQAVRSSRHGGAQARQRGRIRALALLIQLQPVVQRVASDVFHHQIGHHIQIARRHQTRHMRAGQHLHDLVLDLEADDVLCTIARGHARHLHHHLEVGFAPAGVMDPVDQRHAAGVDAVLDQKAVDLGARCNQFQCPVSSRCAKNSGRPAARMLSAAAWWL